MTADEAAALWRRAELGEFNSLPAAHNPRAFMPQGVELKRLGEWHYDAARAFEDWRRRQS
jgi:hypothetical protein